MHSFWEAHCNSQAYKRLHVHFEYDIPNWNRVYYRSTWITGIGDVYFPFFPASCYGPTCHWEYYDPKLFLGQDSLDLREAYPCALLTDIPEPKWEYTPKPVLSPNPASAGQAVHIDFPEQVPIPNWSVVVYRSDGQLVTQVGIRSWNEQAYHLSAGLHWFAFYREDGEHLKTMPLVVQ